MKERHGTRTRRRLLAALVAALVALAAALALPGAALAEDAAARSGSQVTVWRLYNRWSGEHLFTTDREEYDGLVAVGWSGEGEAWRSPAESDNEVWRLYNPYSGDHHYTADETEYERLGDIGWNREGHAFFSADERDGRPIYRLFNRWLTQGTHLFTTDADEYGHLGDIGWSPEGVAFYALGGAGGEDVPDEGEEIGLDDLEALEADGAVEYVQNEDGTVGSILGTFTDGKVLSTPDAAALVNSASELLGGGVSASADDFSSNTDGEDVFWRYSPTVGGVPVVGGQVIVSTEADGTVTGLFSTYDPSLDGFDATPTVTEGQARAAAETALLSEDEVESYLSSLVEGGATMADAADGYLGMQSFEATLVVHASHGGGDPALVYEVEVNTNLDDGTDEVDADDGNDVEGSADIYLPVVSRVYYVYASGEDAGEVCGSSDLFEYYETARQSFELDGRAYDVTVQRDGDECRLVDTENGVSTYQAKRKRVRKDDSYVWEYETPGELVAYGESDDLASKNAAALCAHANVEKVAAFYRDVLGRDSYDDKGSTIRVCVGDGSFKNNATWGWNDIDKPFMRFGVYKSKDGSVTDPVYLTTSLDTVGHELTHGVIISIVGRRLGWTRGEAFLSGLRESVANDGGCNEPGALNEAIPDIIGELIEGKHGSDGWELGEDAHVPVEGSNVKYSLADPESYGCPASYEDRQTGGSPLHDDDYDQGHIHANAAIFSHAAYLMMVDERTEGVDDATWARLFYRAIFRLASDAHFDDARAAVLGAAGELGFDTSQVDAIREAFDAVGIKAPGKIVVTLTWGDEPADLDAHLVGPLDDAHSYHVYCNEMEEATANLDVDARDSRGPEVITIRERVSGDYSYYVCDYTDKGSPADCDLAGSGAKVSVYCDGRVRTFRPSPLGARKARWNVFRMSIDDGKVTIKADGTYEDLSDSWDYEKTGGTFGEGCSWRLDDDGTLTVFPTDGRSGTMGRLWDAVKGNTGGVDVKSVRVKAGVRAPEDSSSLFSGVPATAIDAAGLDVSGVTNMSCMFAGCFSLRDVSGLSGWDTSSVTDMNEMFYGCSSLSDVSPLSGWDTSSVTDMLDMFPYGCRAPSWYAA